MESSEAFRHAVRLLVAAFDRLAAAHIASLLLQDIPDAQIVSAHSGAELEIVVSQPFDLVVLDTRNIENPGALMEAFVPLAQEGCRIAAIVIDEQAEHLRWALNARHQLGIPHGLMPATMTPERCRAAIVHVATGGEYLNWALMGAHSPLASDIKSAPTAPDPVDLAAPNVPDLLDILTPRETQILRLLKQGLRNKEVAERLAISVNTAKIHIASIKRKYRVTSRMQLL